MKYLKYFEDNDTFRCNIDIQALSIEEKRLMCKKLIKWFPSFDFQDDLLDIARIDAQYLKLKVKEYNYIEVSKIYTSIEKERDGVGIPTIDGNLALSSNSIEDFKKCMTAIKYNI
jgi:hypothetical protein